MNLLKEKKEQLVKEFNANRQWLATVQQQIGQLNIRQLQIQAQLQLIVELEKDKGRSKRQQQK